MVTKFGGQNFGYQICFCTRLFRNKLQWNLNKNSCIFIQEDALENVIWKIVAISSRPQCVNVFVFLQLQPPLRSSRLPPRNVWTRANTSIRASFTNAVLVKVLTAWTTRPSSRTTLRPIRSSLPCTYPTFGPTSSWTCRAGSKTWSAFCTLMWITTKITSVSSDERGNIFRPQQNGQYLADDILKFIFLYENCCTCICIQSFKFLKKRFPRVQSTLCQYWFR